MSSLFKWVGYGRQRISDYETCKETLEKHRISLKKTMAVKREIYKTHFRGKISWNDFQIQYKAGANGSNVI